MTITTVRDIVLVQHLKRSILVFAFVSHSMAPVRKAADVVQAVADSWHTNEHENAEICR